MHHGWMLRIHSKYVFSQFFGTNAVPPRSIAEIAGFASSAALTYH